MALDLPTLENCLAQNFGLQTIKWLEVFHGHSSQNVHLRANGAHFVMKRYGDLAARRLSELTLLANFLRAQKYPSVAPVLNRNQSFEFFCDGGVFALFPYQKGRVLHGSELTPIALTQTAKLIAELHRLGTKLPFSLKPSREIIPTTLDLDAQRRARIHRLATFCKNRKCAPLIERSLSIKRVFLEKLPDRFFDFSAIATGLDLLHGDFHNENILFESSSGSICLLDFEECRLGHRIQDLMQFVHLALCNLDYSEISLKNCRKFLKDYRHFAPISNAEIKAGLCEYFANLATSLFFEETYCANGDAATERLIERDIRKLEFYRNHMHFLIDQLTF